MRRGGRDNKNCGPFGKDMEYIHNSPMDGWRTP